MSYTSNERLVSVRNRFNLSQAEVSAAVGVDLRTYQRWEKGTMPQPHYRKKLCEVFHLTNDELGFGTKQQMLSSTEAPLIAPKNQVYISSIQERTVSTSTLLTPVAERATVDMLSIGVQALMIAQQHYGITREELLSGVEQEFRRLDAMTRQHPEKKLSRREVLAFLVTLPAATMGLARTEHTPPLYSEELLPLYVTSVPACWRLFYEGEWREVEGVLPAYIGQLTPLAHQTSRYQQTAASLLSQVYQLAAEVVLQREDFGTSLNHCNQALFYGQLANDSNLQAGALIRRGNTLFYRNRSSLDTYQEAMQYSNDVSPLLRGRIYSEYSCSLRKKLDARRDVEQYMELSHEYTPQVPEEDPYFLYSHSDHYILHFNDMLTYLWFDQPKQAWESILQAGTFVPETINARRLELEKHLVHVSIALGDMDQTITLFQQFAASAATFQSDLSLNDVQQTLEQMQTRWPRERRIHELRSLLA